MSELTKCRECGSKIYNRERRPHGDTQCCKCGFKCSSQDWEGIKSIEFKVTTKVDRLIERVALLEEKVLALETTTIKVELPPVIEYTTDYPTKSETKL